MNRKSIVVVHHPRVDAIPLTATALPVISLVVILSSHLAEKTINVVQ
jgi:hypothetical protein